MKFRMRETSKINGAEDLCTGRVWKNGLLEARVQYGIRIGWYQNLEAKAPGHAQKQQSDQVPSTECSSVLVIRLSN